MKNVLLYDNHTDFIPVYSEEDLQLMKYGLHGRVYPIFLNSRLASKYIEDFPYIMFDERVSNRSLNVSKNKPFCSGYDFGVQPYNFELWNNRGVNTDSKLSVEQIHIDPDLFSTAGIREIFSVDLPKKLFFYDNGINSGKALISFLEKFGERLELLGLYEFYGNLVENKDEQNKVYSAICSLLKKASFSPEVLAIDPSILEKNRDLEGLASEIVYLPDFESPVIIRKLCLTDLVDYLPKNKRIFMIAKSHYSAILTFNLQSMR